MVLVSHAQLAVFPAVIKELVHLLLTTTTTTTLDMVQIINTTTTTLVMVQIINTTTTTLVMAQITLIPRTMDMGQTILTIANNILTLMVADLPAWP